ncbi:serine/threonine protein kinase [Streptomyces sp. TLI_55]|uniref:LamG-like jellyroll fold domain-containing protein n=1 Tax=Streptomyces sp. TLI_55 TaxID=1938861 RepID=UPI000BCE7441|nr:LamG-like jellyroll fold domain-containing protein [Streptomyces sp. TLI_55]SNX64134.1 serine/threonine protein kinase [Streptomyces sp. TLI_55]
MRPTRGRAARLAGAGVTLALALTLAPGMPLAADRASAAPSDATGLTASEKALAEAAATGERVEVVAERTERDTVFANPDGSTLTLEKSIVPVRVAAADGGWVRPDATLVKRADGSVGPRAAAVEMSFSGGGSGADLVTIGDAGRSVSLGWPGTLPEPRLDGARAVYEDVRPDVNLILTATPEGFRQVLEVETLEAAAAPGLRAISYDLDTDGLQARAGAAGSMEVVDGNGQVVFRSPSARMWNSAGDTADGEGLSAQSAGLRPLGAARTGGADTGSDPVPVTGPADENPLDGPGAGDDSALMDVVLDKESVRVVPDAGLLTGTTQAELPLYIDPSVELNESERTVLSSDGDVFYNFSGGTNGMSVGKCGSAVIGGVTYYCGNGYVNRMYFEFAPDKLKGKHVLDAEFNVTETWSFSCDARWVDLERTDPISSSSKWPGPTKLDQMGDRNVSAGRGSACSPAQPAAPIRFHDYAEEPDENLTPTVRSFAAGSFPRLTLMLMAKSESDTVSWKRFDDDAVLTVDYVSTPATPTETGVKAGAGRVCSKSESSPSIITDPKPDLLATPETAAGGESGARLRIYFDVDVKNGTTWSDAPEPTTSSLKPTSGYVAYSSTLKGFPAQTKDWNTPLADGKLHRYRAYTHSLYNSDQSFLSSLQSAWCYFTVDSKAPQKPSITSWTTYSECVTGGSCVAGGGPGKSGTAVFGPAAGETSTNSGYRYRLSSDSAWSAWTSGSTYKATFTPPSSGTYLLHVQAKSAAYPLGGDEQIVRFLVSEGPKPVAHWNFDEPSGAAVDTSTTDSALRDDLTLSAGAVRTPDGRRGEIVKQPATETTTAVLGQDQALKVTNSAYASTTEPVLQTAASYTVAAWVRLDATGRNFTVAGQDGTYYSPFFLSYCEDSKTWCVRLADADLASTSLSNQRVNAKDPAQTGVWTHLAAVVDHDKNVLSLYVNGRIQGTDTITGNWSANGGFQIGRVKYKGAYADPFAGEVDEVTIWQAAQSDVQIADEARLTDGPDGTGLPHLELVADLNASGASGSTIQDTTSNYGPTLTVGSGAKLDGESLVLEGTGGAESASPLVDTTGSFTVAVETMVDGAALKDKPNGYRAQVLGQRTAGGSSWGLWFEKTGLDSQGHEVLDENGDPVIDEATGEPKFETWALGRWHFGLLTADGNGASVQSDAAAVLGTDVELTGAYDAQNQTISLFLVDRQGEPTQYTAPASSGGVAVGKGWLNSAWGNHVPGRVNHIRMWAGAVQSAHHKTAVVGD